ncbi:hypothetical protein HZA57_00100 [Candidatus Poribacteria bacterium]|nr:hypothetical protein [Candidatus Poribacteria bacterium]
MNRSLAARAGLLGLAGLIALAGLWRAWPDTVDDAQITFRYVDNLVAGEGFCFNPGIAVEGFSNPLLVFLLIPPAAAGVPPESAARVLGLASFAFLVVGSWRLTGRLGGASWQRAVAAAAVVGQFPLLYYSVTGLETGLFAALILGAVWRRSAVGEVDAAGWLLWTGVAFSRPEGILYPALLGVAELWRLRGDADARRAVLWLLGVGASFLALTLWRRWTFGDWLPNTFYAKQPGTADLEPAIPAGIAAAKYLWSYLTQAGLVLPVLGVWHCLDKNNRARLVPLSLTVAAGVLFAVYAGGDWMPGGRYLLPVHAPLAVAGTLGLGRLLDHLEQFQIRRSIGLAGAAVIALGTLFGPLPLLWEFFVLRDRYPYHVLNSSACRDAALAIRREFGTGHRIVTLRIGALGRYSGSDVIDLFGLVDRDIARLIARHPAYHPNKAVGEDVPGLSEVIAARDPDMILLLSLPGVPPLHGVTCYGFNYDHRRRYLLGVDQAWDLYTRAGAARP